MNIIDENCMASLEFDLTWESGVGRHKEIFFAYSVRSSRDLLPEKVTRGLMERSLGEQVHLSFSPVELVPPRGRPRPITDRYYPNITTSDPVYAVWGQTAV